MIMPLSKARVGHTGLIETISGNDKIRQFLFSLGCSEGEEITLISVLAGNYIINVKDSRYAIDKKMAKAIQLI
jgi:ferrous iron transport protein A